MSKIILRLVVFVGKIVMRLKISKLVPDALSRFYWSFLERRVDSAAEKEFDCGGFLLGVPPEDHINGIMLLGAYERRTTKIVRENLKEGMCFIDIGGHIGYFTCMAASLLKNTGNVFVFEPHPEMVKKLEANVQRNGYRNVEIIRKAASDVTQVLTFYEHKNSGSPSLYNYSEELENKGLKVPVISMLDFVLEKNIKKIDFMKRDAEGCELQILKSLESARSLVDLSDLKVIVEYHPDLQNNSKTSLSDFIEYLKSFGFKTIYGINDHDDELIGLNAVKQVDTVYMNFYCSIR